ncbi:hypothetical protein FACS189431_2110 [Alphaproteobacteria bacterium]|nr:hypothetical protein FACS189431_2110 [Alphaproteobacteria bacterium]
MKTIRNEFYQALKYEKFEAAYRRSKLQKGKRREIQRFGQNLEANLTNLIAEVRAGTYCPGKYRKFTIKEPKQRTIMALPFRDRVVQQWYVEEFIKPFFVSRFINDSYACVIGHGTHQAYAKLKKYLHRAKKQFQNPYIIKMDISGFFYNINKSILFDILKRNIADENVLNLTHVFVFDTPGNTGIPIGNYTSQYFANIYLNELDQFVKRKLKIRYYLRYMDDFVMVVDSKSTAREIYEICERFLQEKLLLRLNPKSNRMPLKTGVLFCGFHIYSTHILISQNNKKSVRKKIKTFRQTGDREQFITSLTAWNAHVKHANSWHYRQSLRPKILEMLQDSTISNKSIKEKNNGKSN